MPKIDGDKKAKKVEKDKKTLKKALASLEPTEGKKKRKLSEETGEEPQEVSPAAETAADTPAERDDGGEDDDEAGGDGKRKRKRNRTRKPKAAKDEAGAAAVTGPEKATVEGTVYVEGISYDAEEADVKLVFEAVGEVTGIRMPRWHDSGKPRGYAHVVFADASHVEDAIAKLDGQRLMGRYLKVALPKPAKSAAGGPAAPPPEGCRTVFVKNLPYDCDESSVRSVMEQHGEVRDVRLATAAGVGGAQRLKGFGYVQFASEVGTRKAAAAAAAGTLSLSKRLASHMGCLWLAPPFFIRHGRFSFDMYLLISFCEFVALSVCVLLCRCLLFLILSRRAALVFGLRRKRQRAQGVVPPHRREALGQRRSKVDAACAGGKMLYLIAIGIYGPPFFFCRLTGSIL